MPSSRSGADPLDPGPGGFAHRGLHDTAALPENSLSACAAAIGLGAGIECDLRLTRDGHVLLFHDRDARRLCAEPMRIGRSALDAVRRLRIGAEPIPLLTDLLRLVGGRVPLLLEVKVDGDLRRWLPALRTALAGYHGPVGVMSFDPRLSRLMKHELPQVRRGLVLRDRRFTAANQLALKLAAPDFLAVDVRAVTQPWVARAREKYPVYCWTVRSPDQRAQAAVQADALIWESDGRPRD